MNWIEQFDKQFIQKIGNNMHLQNIDEQEWTAMKWYVRGFIAGIKDTHTKDLWEMKLEDYWHGWDKKYDLNIWMNGDKIKCTVYALKRNGFVDYQNFEELDYDNTFEVIE